MTRAVASRRGAALIAGWALAVLATAATLGLSAVGALAAEPTATPVGGDVRTSPTAPGLAGDPLFAVAGVVVVGLLALGLTLLASSIAERR